MQIIPTAATHRKIPVIMRRMHVHLNVIKKYLCLCYDMRDHGEQEKCREFVTFILTRMVIFCHLSYSSFPKNRYIYSIIRH